MRNKLFLFLFFTLICNYSSASSNKTQEQLLYSDSKSTNVSSAILEENITAEELLKMLPNDKVLGNKNAPITMIEYASFSCYHCALFHMNVFPTIEKDYIKTGKVLFIFRNFPLDYKSLKASMLGYCYHNTNDYFTFNKVMFSLIDSWNNKPNDLSLLESVARISDIDREKFNQCISNKDVFDTIINEKFLATKKLKITATPIFFINGKRYEGFHNLNYFTALFNSLIKEYPNYSIAKK